MILFDNMVGFSGNKVSLSRNGSVHLISHGHFDHLPASTITSASKIICSDITRQMIQIRQNKDVTISHDNNVEMLDSGHTLGSKMFYLKDEELLYTGDFNTISKHFGSAKPRKCRTLVVECTYGLEKYIFPNYEHVISDFIDYVKDHKKVSIRAYSFGKAQEICHLLDSHNIAFEVRDSSIRKINAGLSLKFKNEERRADVVLTKDDLPGHKSVALSGWAIDPGFKYWNRCDSAFVLSDHADYPGLIHFIVGCQPEKIYTYHGFAVEFAESLRKAGFDAEPLLKNQSKLSDFGKNASDKGK
jgi:putative mRNA 3-end processing factor